MDIKQVIVVHRNTKPKMRKGKAGAQVGHAVEAFYRQRMREALSQRPSVLAADIVHEGTAKALGFSRNMVDWIMGDSAKKIVLGVETEAELLEIEAKAREAGLEVHLITDSGLTEFAGPTKTCLAIGPDTNQNIDPITGHLEPL